MIVHRNKYFLVQNNDEYFSLHFNHKSVVVLPTIEEHVIFVKVFRRVLNKVFLELPAGHIENDERPVEAARRELLEETGVNVQDLSKFMSLGVTYPMPSRTCSYVNLFSVEISSKQFECRVDHDEEIESTHLIKFSEIDDLILRNEICISSHISAIHYFDILQKIKNK